MIYNAHVLEQPSSYFALNTDHKIFTAKDKRNDQNNLQAIHKDCNEKKGDN